MLGLCPLTSLNVPADWQVEGGWLGLCWHYCGPQWPEMKQVGLGSPHSQLGHTFHIHTLTPCGVLHLEATLGSWRVPPPSPPSLGLLTLCWCLQLLPSPLYSSVAQSSAPVSLSLPGQLPFWQRR